MKEIREILTAATRLAKGEKAILATVIDVRGSGYRLPGARMLILASGETFGTVSGGCLEADVLERAKKILATGQAEVFTYDTTADENSVFSLNMGCRGVIRILLEAVENKTQIIGSLRAIQIDRKKRLLGTVISAPEGTNIGGRVIVGPDDGFLLSGPAFGFDIQTFEKIRQDCVRLKNGEPVSSVEKYVDKSGEFELFLETIEPPINVLLFGAGADAVPLVRIAGELGWQVTVHDHRPAFLTEERFPTATRLVAQNVDQPLDNLNADARTAAVIMTHNYARDRFILPALLRSEVFYIGTLGPKRRTEQLLEELTASEDIFSPDQLACLYAPVGLDIGADTPESIALSIVGEIQSVLRSRGGAHLRDRRGSIYDRK